MISLIIIMASLSQLKWSATEHGGCLYNWLDEKSTGDVTMAFLKSFRNFQLEALRATAQKTRVLRKKDAWQMHCPFFPGGDLLLQITEKRLWGSGEKKK